MRRLFRTTPQMPPDSPMNHVAFPGLKSSLNRIRSPNDQLSSGGRVEGLQVGKAESRPPSAEVACSVMLLLRENQVNRPAHPEPDRLTASLLPTSTFGLAPGTTSVSSTKERDKRDHAARLPSCRADTELRPLATARPRRFDWPARGTHEYLEARGHGPAGSQPRQTASCF
jgi:hypothetical protein